MRSVDLLPGSLVESQAMVLGTLVIIPILILGADFFLDEMLQINEELRRKIHFRSLIYLSLAIFAIVVVGSSVGADSYRQLLILMARNFFLTSLILILVFALTKVALKRRFDSTRKSQIEKIDLELPQYLEMFHILVSSGMSVLTALKSLSRGESKSPTRRVIAKIITSVENGRSVERAMDEVIIPVGSEQLRRFSDAVIIGMERGSSMGQSLRSLISESRNQTKILLLRRAGRAEIQLLIPVVFLILPVSILFALWPSYNNLVSILG